MRNIWNVTAATLICTVGFAFASAESIGQEGFSDFPLVVDGSTVEDFVADRERAAGVLSELLELDVVDQGDAAIRLLQGIDDGFITQEEAPAGLRGIGGLGVRLVARAFLLDEAHRVRGKIRDYLYDEGTASGHLAVDVRTEFFASAKDRDSGRPPVRTELLHWDIEIDGAYEVHPRGLDFLDPFPDVDLELPGYAIASIWNRDLKYKLHAKGPGIIVRHIYSKVDDNPIQRVRSEDPRYAQTDEACIDIFFNPYPPETELPPQIGYCLGRCEQPAVVNTGG